MMDRFDVLQDECVRAPLWWLWLTDAAGTRHQMRGFFSFAETADAATADISAQLAARRWPGP
jgi:hypothetical protein